MSSKVEATREQLSSVCTLYEQPKKRFQDIAANLQTVEATQVDVHHAFHMAHLTTSKEYPEVGVEIIYYIFLCPTSLIIRCKVSCGWQSATLP